MLDSNKPIFGNLERTNNKEDEHQKQRNYIASRLSSKKSEDKRREFLKIMNDLDMAIGGKKDEVIDFMNKAFESFSDEEDKIIILEFAVLKYLKNSLSPIYIINIAKDNNIKLDLKKYTKDFNDSISDDLKNGINPTMDIDIAKEYGVDLDLKKEDFEFCIASVIELDLNPIETIETGIRELNEKDRDHLIRSAMINYTETGRTSYHIIDVAFKHLDDDQKKSIIDFDISTSLTYGFDLNFCLKTADKYNIEPDFNIEDFKLCLLKRFNLGTNPKSIIDTAIKKLKNNYDKRDVIKFFVSECEKNDINPAKYLSISQINLAKLEHCSVEDIESCLNDGYDPEFVIDNIEGGNFKLNANSFKNGIVKILEQGEDPRFIIETANKNGLDLDFVNNKEEYKNAFRLGVEKCLEQGEDPMFIMDTAKENGVDLDFASNKDEYKKMFENGVKVSLERGLSPGNIMLTSKNVEIDLELKKEEFQFGVKVSLARGIDPIFIINVAKINGIDLEFNYKKEEYKKMFEIGIKRSLEIGYDPEYIRRTAEKNDIDVSV